MSKSPNQAMAMNIRQVGGSTAGESIDSLPRSLILEKHRCLANITIWPKMQICRWNSKKFKSSKNLTYLAISTNLPKFHVYWDCQRSMETCDMYRIWWKFGAFWNLTFLAIICNHGKFQISSEYQNTKPHLSVRNGVLKYSTWYPPEGLSVGFILIIVALRYIITWILHENLLYKLYKVDLS